MDSNANMVYVIAGFPKSLDNMESWKRKMFNSCHVKAFFHFDCPSDILEKRLDFMGIKDAELENCKKRH
jgi:hypothetical protein